MKFMHAVMLAATLSAMGLVMAAHSQENMTFVRSDAFTAHQRPAAGFRHDAHNEKAKIDACNQCHHVYQDGKLVEDESSEDKRCGDCHGLEDSDRQPGLMKAFHLNCKGCHQEKRKGPVMCGECHVRR
jgi:hypothetical protein